jgi:hypothetical protein
MRPVLRRRKYRLAVAAFITNRTSLSFDESLAVVEWEWPILMEAYEAGDRFQAAGERIMQAAEVPRSAVQSCPLARSVVSEYQAG